jgi:hypothetical protein
LQRSNRVKGAIVIVPRVGAKGANAKGIVPKGWFLKGGFQRVVSKALLCARARNEEKSLIEVSSQPYAQVLVSCLGVRGLELERPPSLG